MTDFVQLVAMVADAGEAEVREVYEVGSPKQEGALEGFRLVRECKDVGELLRLYEGVQQASCHDRQDAHKKRISMDEYWRRRWSAMQIEWAWEITKVALVNAGLLPVDRTPLSARAVMQYARLVGVGEPG